MQQTYCGLLLCVVVVATCSALSPTFERRRACSPPHDTYSFCNMSWSTDDRIANLISYINDDDKPGLLTARGWPQGNITSLDRIGVPGFDWGLNCVHGVQSDCVGDVCPTSFPNPNALGASWNFSNVGAMSSIMAKEVRALYVAGAREPTAWSGRPLIGLDCWSPNININRDPRWGRNMEVASEDPLLTSDYAFEYSTKLQQTPLSDEYYAAIPTIKHWAAYSLDDSDGFTRYDFDAHVDAFDLTDTYLVAFHTGITKANAKGVMCSYNALNGIPTCANPLLENKLRNEWNYSGYVTSDTGAVQYIYQSHNYTKTPEEAACAALREGRTDIDSGFVYQKYLAKGVALGLCSMSDVDNALTNIFRIQFQLGLFDNIPDHPYWHIPLSEVGTSASIEQSVYSAQQGMVLLSNWKPTPQQSKALPLRNMEGKRIAVVGPNANNSAALLGNYLGWMCPGGNKDYSCVETVYDALKTQFSDSDVTFTQGCNHSGPVDAASQQQAAAAAKTADAVVMVMGLSLELEGEMHDRVNISLPSVQTDLVFAVTGAVRSGVPVIMVLVNGGALSIERELPLLSAVLEAWYPGKHGAKAIAATLAGLNNPGGKLPVTIYPSTYIHNQKMSEMSMTSGVGRTYKYYKNRPLFNFGHGLSYTEFTMSPATFTPYNVSFAIRTRIAMSVNISLSNIGAYDGDEVVQIYMKPIDLSPSKSITPNKKLVAYRRTHVAKGSTQAVSLDVGLEQLCLVSVDGKGARRLIPAGSYVVWISTNGNDSNADSAFPLDISSQLSKLYQCEHI